MGTRTTRSWIAILLTGMDIAIFEHSFTAIWLVWSGLAWIRVVSILVLAVWAGSAAVLWLHVYYDLRQVLRGRCLIRSRIFQSSFRLRGTFSTEQ